MGRKFRRIRNAGQELAGTKGAAASVATFDRNRVLDNQGWKWLVNPLAGETSGEPPYGTWLAVPKTDAMEGRRLCYSMLQPMVGEQLMEVSIWAARISGAALPRCLQSRSRSARDALDSRNPSPQRDQLLRPSARGPINTSRHSFAFRTAP